MGGSYRSPGAISPVDPALPRDLGPAPPYPPATVCPPAPDRRAARPLTVALLAAAQGLLLAATLAAHGGQFLPPLPDPVAPLPSGAILLQPGFGPLPVYRPDRWEWWFDFNKEELLDLRRRQRERAAADPDREVVPVDDALRRKQLVPLLRELTGHHNRDVRSTATLALARTGLADQLPKVREMTRDNDLFVRCNALLAVGMLGGPPAVERLGKALADRDLPSEQRIFAAAALALAGGPEAREILARRLTKERMAKENNLLQAGLLYAAGLSEDPELLAPLAALESTWMLRRDGQLRAVWVVALGRLGAPGGLPHVLAHMDDQDNQVRRSAGAALEALATLLDGDQLTAVIEHTADENDVPARINLLRALGRVRRPDSRAFLTERLAKATTLMLPHLALALGMDGHPDNLEPILARLADTSDQTAVSALAVSLGLLGQPAAADELTPRFLAARDPLLQGYLCLGLGLLDVASDDARKEMLHLAETTHDVELVRLSVTALGLLGEEAALEQLAGTTRELRGTLDRAARLYALGPVADARLAGSLAAVAADERQPSYVITYAAQALGALGDPLDRSDAWRFSRFVELNHDLAYLIELYRVP